MPRVSIVLPTYNGACYLRDSIESVIAQTLSDWELWIVDDCSTDATGAIAEEYATRDNRIHVIHNTINRKLPASLNIGFHAAAPSDYLTWTSDDNWYHQTALEEMMAWLDAHPEVPMVCAGVRVVDAEKNFLRRLPIYEDCVMPYGDVVGACFLYRGEVLEIVGDYDENLFCVEDYEYWIRILRHYGHIGWIDKVLYSYRWHEASLTQTKRERVKRKRTELRHKHFDWIFEHLQGRKRELFLMYHEMSETGGLLASEAEALFHALPELRRYRRTVEDQRLVCWGAGEIGHKAAAEYGSRIMFFIDRNPARKGENIDGIPIRSLSALDDVPENAIVMLTMGVEKIFEPIAELLRRGIEEYAVCFPLSK